MPRCECSLCVDAKAIEELCLSCRSEYEQYMSEQYEIYIQDLMAFEQMEETNGNEKIS